MTCVAYKSLLLRICARSPSPSSPSDNGSPTVVARRFSGPSLNHRRPPVLRSTSAHVPAPVVSPVTISYTELCDPGADILEKIEFGFGPSGLGILSVSDVPGYTSLRQNLLHLAPRLASLPEEAKQTLEDANSRYNIGWSHGKEKLESGKPDLFKGSFYANPILDIPTTDQLLVKRYPSYCGPNLWPHNVLPELESAFKALGKLVLNVGLLVGHHCDRYVSNGSKFYEGGSLQQILLRSRCHKGRLLYYFPSYQRVSNEDGESVSSWCGWHTDHGSLTGLTCGMFTRDAVELPCPDSAAGLYIKTRSGQIVKVVYGEGEIAYQIGEITEILSGGQLCATPHCVRAPRGEAASGVDRSTFALFMQPDWDEMLIFPEQVNIHEFMTPKGSISFGDYSEKVLNKYYHSNA